MLAGGILAVSTLGTGAVAAEPTPSSTPVPSPSGEPVAPKVTGWGSCDAVRTAEGDQFTLEVAAAVEARLLGPVQVEISAIELFGTTYTVAGRELVGPDQKKYAYQVDGELRYDAISQKLQLAATGEGGRLTVAGIALNPPAGEEFPKLALRGPAEAKHEVRAAARKFRAPDHAPAREKGPAVLAAMKKFSDYLDGRRTEKGWLIGSGWGAPGEDAQGIAGIATGYLQLHYLTGDAGYEQRARRALDWLVDNQQPAGGFGMPWAWGLHNGHFAPGIPEHYEDGKTHPAGYPYAVNALNAGIALVIGFERFADQRYLAAAKRVGDFVLDAEHGFQWLDVLRTRGSIPYCNLRPVVPLGDPRLINRQVLPTVANTSVEVYNIDAYGIRFLLRLKRVTGNADLDQYVNALLRNLLFRIESDGAIDYAWCQNNRPDFYTYAVAAALVEMSPANQDVFDATRRMLTWRANAYPPGAITNEAEGVTLLGLDNTTSASGYLAYTLRTQKPAGDWSDGKNTRSDVDKLNAATLVLIQSGLGPVGAAAKKAGAQKAAKRVKSDLLLSDPAPLMATQRAKRKPTDPPTYYP